MERLRESSSRKKHSNALKAEEDRSEESSEEDESSSNCEDEEAMLSRRLQRILAKKKKFQSGRRYFKKNKEFKKPDGKDQKKGEPICYECKKPGHIKEDCPKFKKPEFRKKESSKKFRRHKKKAMAAAWSNSSDSDSESSSSCDEEEANLVFMANTEEKTEADGTLASIVKGTQIKITRDLLAPLFDVSTTGHSGVHLVDTQVKGLGIIGPEFRLKDGKMDINQLSAFNRLLHFIICQIIVPRSASFSTCARADSDLMFWAIQNQEINTAELIIERMKFSSSQVWDTKSKLNISLPYAHLLTRIFQHFDISVVGDVFEKMGQAIRSRNLRKSGFSVVNSVWSKTGAVEGEAIIGEAQEDLELVADAAAVVEPEEATIDPIVPAAVEDEASRRIEDIPPDFIEPLGKSLIAESVAEGHTEEVVMEEAPSQQEQVSVQVDVVMEDAPIEGEHSVTEDIQGESVVASGHTEVPSEDLPVQEEAVTQPNVPMEIVTEEEEVGVEKGSDDGDLQAPVDQAGEKGKEVALEVPLLADTPYQRSQRQKIVINLKPVIERLDAQGEILCSLQSDVNSIFMSQASVTKELSQVRNAMKWFNKEMGSMKSMLSEILKAVGAQAPPPPPPAAQRSEKDDPRPSGPDEQVAGPSGPTTTSSQAEVSGSGPSGQVEVSGSGPSGPAEKVSGPSRPLESESVQQIAEEEEAVSPEPPAPSSTQTPVPPSPPSSSTAPPAPQTFKKPQPITISSPTPFPSQPTSSPISSTTIPPPPPIFAVPIDSSSVGASSSSGPPSSGPSDIPPTTSHSLLHPSPPPSFITIIPEGAQLESPYLRKVKDEFEEVILRSVLKVGDHIHRADSSSSAPKKRKFSSLSSEPSYPPLWFSLTGDNKNKPLYIEYLQKVFFASIINLPFLNLSDHLNVILPYTSLTKSEKSKIFSIAHSKTEEQWARGHRELYKKFLLAKSARFPPRDHSLTLLEWFQIHHKNCWAPFI
ncbi:hypothetical protein Taro_030528 [Colocasia esculenta]|uniref:CCHC-type domain-containing protein n=1 Tax=Colocasia esculenta TaxID=4460 RepID=A0A843VU98_COLES|nr:hypothetical protein [Colocasia esculenta]